MTCNAYVITKSFVPDKTVVKPGEPIHFHGVMYCNGGGEYTEYVFVQGNKVWQDTGICLIPWSTEPFDVTLKAPKGEGQYTYTAISDQEMNTPGCSGASATIIVSSTSHPGKGLLVIDTSPEAATIYINGTKYGLSPLHVWLSPGVYMIKAEKPGYKTVSSSAVVHEGYATRVSITLTPLSTSGQIYNKLLLYGIAGIAIGAAIKYASGPAKEYAQKGYMAVRTGAEKAKEYARKGYSTVRPYARRVYETARAHVQRLR